MLLSFCGETKVTKRTEKHARDSAYFFIVPKKIFTNYLEKENCFCIFVVKLRILLPFHYNKFESNLAKGRRSSAWMAIAISPMQLTRFPIELTAFLF